MDSHQRKTLETAANEAVKRALQMQPGNGGESREKPPQPTAFHKRHEVELGIEFCLELLVVFYQLGRELMGLPVNVPLGAGCWAVAMLIAIRIFWIVPFTQTFPLWLKATTGALIFAIAVQVSWHTVNEAYRQQIAGEQMTPDTKLLLGAIKALGVKPTDTHTHVSFIDPLGHPVMGAPEWPFRVGDVPQVPMAIWNSGNSNLKQTARAGAVILATKNYALGEKMFDDFLRDAKYVSEESDIPPYDPTRGTYATFAGPKVADKDVQPLLSDEEALCAMGRIEWQDENGCYATDFCECQWAEPSPSNYNWHICKSHNGTETKLACTGSH